MTDDCVLRPLGEDDREAIRRLIEADPGFATRITGRPSHPDEAHELLTGRPPGLAEDQKVALGLFRRDALVAVVDLLRGWPDPDTAHIGLLQVHTRYKGQGAGRRAHDLTVKWIRSWPEVHQLRAAIVETNASHADPFWAAMGYKPVGEPKPFERGTVQTTVAIWTRPITHD